MAAEGIDTVLEGLMVACGHAFRQVGAELDSLGEEELLPWDVHVPEAILTVMHAAPRVEALAVEASARIPETFDMRNVTRLRVYAAAAWHAHIQATVVSDEVLRWLVAEAGLRRTSLWVWATALAERGLVRIDKLERVGSRPGPFGLAHDLIALGDLLAEAWPRIANKCALQLAEVEQAQIQGLDLWVGLAGTPDGGGESMVQARARAFTLLARAYDECRRLVAYLRWDEEDREDITPSIGVEPRDEAEEDEEPTGLPSREPTPVRLLHAVARSKPRLVN